MITRRNRAMVEFVLDNLVWFLLAFVLLVFSTLAEAESAARAAC